MRRPTTTWAFASTRSVRSAPLTLDDLPGAIESWTHALRLAPDSPDAHTNLASAYIMSKPPQFFCCRERKVFVCVEVCHAVITHYAASLALICSSISAVWERQ